MRIFTASLAAETNTFSPLPVSIQDFYDSFYAPPGKHPETPTLCSGPMVALRKRARQEGFELVEGTAAWAEPGGVVNRQAYEHLRNEILAQLEEALPVQGVVLGLHGAMVAQGYDDCEGDLLQRVRKLAGAEAFISAELDPHSNLTKLMLKNSDLLIHFKEFPHSDFYEQAERLVDLSLKAINGQIKPVQSVFDCRMIDVFPTTREPTRSFVDRLKSLEGKDKVLSISFVHGFLAGDVPELGSKILVVTDNDQVKGDALAAKLGKEAFALRGRSQPEYLTPRQAVEKALSISGKPIVLADVWDNPGGGVAGDSTIILSALMEMGVKGAALATIWDPIAVRFCMAAGEGARLKLRFGAKVCPEAGDPIDREVLVKKVKRNATQTFGDSVVPLGDSAMVDCDGIEVILNTVRSQAFGVDAFSNLGVEPRQKKILVVKSTNHFYAAFSPIAKEIFYVNSGDMYPHNAARTEYRKLRRAIWPRVHNPFRDDAAD